MSTPQRLQKILASAGIASRRHSEDLIESGRVAVNGTVVTELGSKADPEVDRITVDGIPLSLSTEKVYLALNKPGGYITSRRDPRRRRTVMDLVPDFPGLHPVGRLDYDTSGLLILTNDGDFTHALTHPRYGIAKTYQAMIQGRPSEMALNRLREGVVLDDGPTAPAVVHRLGSEGRAALIQITIHEGRNRQIRRMFEAIGFPVIRLQRTAIGPVYLRDIQMGNWRPLTQDEITALWTQSKYEET